MKFITVTVLMTSSNFNLSCCGSICLHLFTWNLISLPCFTLPKSSSTTAIVHVPSSLFFTQSPPERPHTIKQTICRTQKSTLSSSSCALRSTQALVQRWGPRKRRYSSREAGHESQKQSKTAILIVIQLFVFHPRLQRHPRTHWRPLAVGLYFQTSVLFPSFCADLEEPF